MTEKNKKWGKEKVRGRDRAAYVEKKTPRGDNVSCLKAAGGDLAAGKLAGGGGWRQVAEGKLKASVDLTGMPKKVQATRRHYWSEGQRNPQRETADVVSA